ncbi:putative alpha-galactosidase C [Aspergillus floccosus]
MVPFVNSAAFVAGLFTLWSCPSWAIQASNTNAVVVNGMSFTLNGDHASYRFHADDATGDLFSDHFGGRISGNIPTEIVSQVNGWVNTIGRVRREFPDQGRGDFRIPAIRIRQTAGYTVSELLYRSHTVIPGKPALPGLPATFGSEEDVTTLVVHLYDEISEVAADLSYSIFPKYDAIVRSVNVTNQGAGNITIETLASLSVDFPYEDLDMVYLRGDWAREAHSERRKVEYGTQGFDSSAGYSSHLHNPFLAIMNPSTTESQGEAWGFSLVYSGSFAVNVERGSQGFTRALLGLNPDQLSWVLRPGESLVSPECVAVYSADGIGGMSRLLHRLYRNHLIKSKFAVSDRPVLLNSWEGLSFNYNESTVYQLATDAADLGVKLFVLDDGWFGDEYPRTADNAGLGDWIPNPDRFPHGLPHEVDRITALHPGNDTSTNLRFGLWFEPEMVNPNSSLYHQHPDWALHAGSYPRTLTRNQLVLNLALPEVQDFVIKSVSDILDSADISYVKWDNNRGIHETPLPSTDHQYMLGIYRVFDTLTTKYPNVLWEGCASGGGRFDPGVLHYFPQIWTSDNTDALERITIQLGTSLAYPPSAMGAHLSAVPNQQTGRTLPITFRAHVAMMGGSFGLELNPAHMPEDERDVVPGLIALAEKVNPIVLTGDMYRLSPHDSQWPAVLFISPDGEQAILFYFQTSPRVDNSIPRVKMQGLDPEAVYSVDGDAEYSGATLMSLGLQFAFDSDVGSKVVFFQRL